MAFTPVITPTLQKLNNVKFTKKLQAATKGFQFDNFSFCLRLLSRIYAQTYNITIDLYFTSTIGL